MIGFILFGLVVGIVARLIVPGRQRMGMGLTILLGIVGSVVGGVVANAVGSGDIMELNFLGAVVAIVTAVVLIALGERATGGRRGLR
ncbi:MAG TPA: GlsB/YeaQ/YmgE family stress response membrane protein [Frankiaceae bacterium]|nr:GlsB/YeaQ/YmgE family stress response membrane protein [Frankiaceae bacterium]